MTESGLFFVYFSSFQTQILHKLQASAKLELGRQDNTTSQLQQTANSSYTITKRG